MQEETCNVKCGNCNNSIIKSNNNEVKMRALVIKWNSEGCFAVCKSCKQDVPINFDILKSINTRFTYEVKNTGQS